MHDDIENIMIKECQEEICFSIIFKNENLHNCTPFELKKEFATDLLCCIYSPFIGRICGNACYYFMFKCYMFKGNIMSQNVKATIFF